MSWHQLTVSVSRVRDFPGAVEVGLWRKGEARSRRGSGCFGAREGRCRSLLLIRAEDLTPWILVRGWEVKLLSLQGEGCRPPLALAVECLMVFGPLSLLVARHQTTAAVGAAVLVVVASVLLFLFLCRGYGVTPVATAGVGVPWSVRVVPSGGVLKL